MTPDTNTELLMNKIDVCNDAVIERLETIIELLQDIRTLLTPSPGLSSLEIDRIIENAIQKAKK